MSYYGGFNTDQPQYLPDETYVDDDGRVWQRPTAWAYFAVCRALEQHRAANAELIRLLREK